MYSLREQLKRLFFFPSGSFQIPNSPGWVEYFQWDEYFDAVCLKTFRIISCTSSNSLGFIKRCLVNHAPERDHSVLQEV